MKICTSYFYQIRNFKPYMIPVSTAVWDPKWYHSNNDYGTYFDKNNVINGLKAQQFVPGITCNNLCNGYDKCTYKSPDTCAFLINYRKQLDNLNIQEVLDYFNQLGLAVKEQVGFTEEPIIALIVYEAPQNPCSERCVIQGWFRDNGVPIEELNPKLYS